MVKKTDLNDLLKEKEKKPKIFWTPEENETQLIRIINPIDQDWVYSITQHFILQKNYICPTTLEQECPICNKGLELYKKYKAGTTTEQDSKLFSIIKRSQKHVVQILLRSKWEEFKKKYGSKFPTEKPNFDENPVKIFFIGNSLWEKILFWAKPKTQGGRGLGEIWDNNSGRDIELIKQKSDAKKSLADFSMSGYADEKTKLAETEEDINYILNVLVYKWDEVIKITPASQLKTILADLEKIVYSGKNIEDLEMSKVKESNNETSNAEVEDDLEIENLLNDIKKKG